MAQTENTIRFEDFAAVTRDSGEVLGKVRTPGLNDTLTVGGPTP